MTQRNKIRQEILSTRKNLDDTFKAETSQKICKDVLKLSEFINAEKIAIYMANQGEVNPIYLLPPHSEETSNKKYYLPILDPNKPNHLLFQESTLQEELIENRFGIPEPKLNPEKLIDPQNLDCVLVPLVAFDNEGNRLGMGVGYYDRSFSFLQNKKRPHKPVLIGLSYAFQKIPLWTPESWDIPLDMVVTENEILILKKPQ